MEVWGNIFAFITFPPRSIKQRSCYITEQCISLYWKLRVVWGWSWEWQLKLFIMTEIIIFIHETETQMPFRKPTWEMFPSDKESNKTGPRPYSPASIFNTCKVPCADKCLINKIKKRFGCSLNPSPGPFCFWISRLIIFSGQTVLPLPHSVSFLWLSWYEVFLPQEA